MLGPDVFAGHALAQPVVVHLVRALLAHRCLAQGPELLRELSDARGRLRDVVDSDRYTNVGHGAEDSTARVGLLQHGVDPEVLLQCDHRHVVHATRLTGNLFAGLGNLVPGVVVHLVHDDAPLVIGLIFQDVQFVRQLTQKGAEPQRLEVVHEVAVASVRHVEGTQAVLYAVVAGAVGFSVEMSVG